MNTFHSRLPRIMSWAALMTAWLVLPLSAQPVQSVMAPVAQANVNGNDLFTARSSVLGAAYVGVADDTSSVLLNPAGLAILPRGEAEFDSYFGFADTMRENAAVALPLSKLGGVGFSESFEDDGTFVGRDTLGSITSNYNVEQIDLEASGALRLSDRFQLGVGLGYDNLNIAGSISSYFHPQIGLLLETGDQWRWGLDYDGLGWGTGNSVVSTLRGGTSIKFPLSSSFHILTAAGGEWESNSTQYLQAGAEFSVDPGYFVRVGYRFPLENEEGGGISGWALGAGLRIGSLSLDYAYLSGGDLGDTHRIGVGYLFPEEKEKPKAVSVPLSGEGSLPGMAGAPASQNGPVTFGSQGVTTPNQDSLKLKFVIPPDFVAQGEALESQMSYMEAVSLYQRAIKQDPSNTQAWWDLGKLYLKLKKNEYAIQCLEKVQTLRPDDQALKDWLKAFKAKNPTTP